MNNILAKEWRQRNGGNSPASIPLQVFSPDWFAHHQGKLIWLLNHWLTRRWFRWVLCIRRYDIGYDKTIIELRPHAYMVLLGEEELIGDSQSNGVAPSTIHSHPINFRVATDFRTHEKYAKRLYYAFAPVWWTLHFWDWLIADRLMPRLSFGFSTLTVYPDPSSGAVTMDAMVQRTGVDDTLSTIRSFSGNGTTAEDGPNIGSQITASTTSNQFAGCYRAILTFDTRSLPVFAAISSAVFSMWGSLKGNGLGDDGIHLVAAAPANNNSINTADYASVGSTSFGSVSYASFATSAYNDISLNAAGLSHITEEGISKFANRGSWEYNNSFTGVWASGLNSRLFYSTSDTAGSGNDPKLVVTYLVPQNSFRPPGLRPAIFTPGLAR